MMDTRYIRQKRSNIFFTMYRPHIGKTNVILLMSALILFILYLNGFDNDKHSNYFLQSQSTQYFIFGYGSLINAASREQTGISGKAIPVRVHHMKRGWIYDVDIAHHPKLSNTPYTAVGVEMDEQNFDSTVNGVIFTVECEEMKKFDLREARYERIAISKNDIEIINDADKQFLDANSVIYAYFVPHEIVMNDASKRILRQSYIDKFIAGCLEVNGTEFAVECIKTTNEWNGKYYNDRMESLFSKQRISKDTKAEIDGLIHTYLPSLNK